MSLSQAQRDILLTGIKPDRVKVDNKGMSYLEGYEITAHLNRIFGFEGWDKHVTRLELVFEDSEVQPAREGRRERLGWWVCYRATVRLVINGGEIVKEDVGTGSAENQPSRADAHDLAVKSAVTGALKRAAVDLGDQFGLSLYRKGSTDALVKRVIPYENPDPGPALRG
jgi:recombination DNA repair RAD52 pathway protein